ncbi:MAG: TraU family protein [Candidatus Omnitrophica bacterium]|nr:TraU family protein [Candidatus Omnitrophota bacterium]
MKPFKNISALILLLVSSAFPFAARSESLAVLTGRADWNCVRLELTGQACSRVAPPYAGVMMRYWQPVLMVETVKRPGDTAVNEYRSLLGEPLKQMAATAMGAGSANMDSGSGYSADTTAVQMSDVHVMGFPASSIFSAIIEPVCEGSPELSSSVSYLSERDAVEWRTLKNESRHPMSLLSAAMAPMCEGGQITTPGMCIGVWGPLYPRGGFIAGYSPVVGSAALAYRGVDIASINPLSVFHSRVMPLLFVPDPFWDRMQMVYPQASRCLKIGEDPRTWEQDRVSADGKYVWIYWRKKECCAL